jgi:hypothetical protein
VDLSLFGIQVEIHALPPLVRNAYKQKTKVSFGLLLISFSLSTKCCPLYQPSHQATMLPTYQSNNPTIQSILVPSKAIQMVSTFNVLL